LYCRPIRLKNCALSNGSDAVPLNMMYASKWRNNAFSANFRVGAPFVFNWSTSNYSIEFTVPYDAHYTCSCFCHYRRVIDPFVLMWFMDKFHMYSIQIRFWCRVRYKFDATPPNSYTLKRISPYMSICAVDKTWIQKQGSRFKTQPILPPTVTPSNWHVCYTHGVYLCLSCSTRRKRIITSYKYW
jgi:hypothetical protein